MERRELYDPEDIESLLQERGYDELLEEERAFVLRHLSGREEYEAMRTLFGGRSPLFARSQTAESALAMPSVRSSRSLKMTRPSDPPSLSGVQQRMPKFA